MGRECIADDPLPVCIQCQRRRWGCCGPPVPSDFSGNLIDEAKVRTLKAVDTASGPDRIRSLAERMSFYLVQEKQEVGDGGDEAMTTIDKFRDAVTTTSRGRGRWLWTVFAEGFCCSPTPG